VFLPLAELMVERARREHCGPGLFIGWLGRFPAARYFSWLLLSIMRARS
jgi:hypothetical protein